MCTKTKTSYGCGHKFKTQQPCGELSCTQVDKFHFQKDNDCQACRSGGEAVTRGRDGKGRYGQKQYRSTERATTPPPSSSTARQYRPDTIDISGGVSPWTLDDTKSVPWHSPIRKNADHAWLDEHDARLADLRQIVDKFSISSRSSRNVSPANSNERLVLRGDDEYFPPKLRYAKTMPLPYEYQNPEYDSDLHSHRRSHRGRKASQRSEDSMPEYFEGPNLRFRKTNYAASSSERDQYGKKRFDIRGAKTEPHPYARSHMYESPISGSPIEGAYYLDSYEMNQPSQYGYTYSRGYR